MATRDDSCREKVERYGRSRREKQKPPLWKRVAKRRRRAALAKHHRKVMKLAAAAKSRGATVRGYPKRPPKPKE